ncbi:tetratricopeptide repeat protein [Bacteroides graminisolvens]|uniref:tetratricopeptide repeat protein n=1 Tax=Bacteroides graminisolvens TaxID=477666 RepID=UPI0023EF61E7|nr:tetratricopeptide repeat protein [Bacteroides graminisolvens]
MPKIAKQILDLIGNIPLMELSAYSIKYGLSFCILTIVGILNANGQSYYDLSEKGVSCFEKDSLEQAENYFRQALKLDPTNAHNALLFSNLGMVQQKMNKHAEAVESYSYALNFAPIAVPILLNRGSAYMNIGQNDNAYLDYCQVLDVDKDNIEALLMRAYIYTQRKDFKAGRADYEKLLKIEPTNYTARLGLITLNQKDGKLNEALEGITMMITENPKDATLYIARADIECDLDKKDMALIDLDEALRLNDSASEAYLLRGQIFLSQKKKYLAKLSFDKAISLGISASDLQDLIKECK